MSRSLINCKPIPGWVKSFLMAVANGKNDLNSAGVAGISTTQVRDRLAKDPAFQEQYDKATEQGARRKNRQIM